jgi:predicted dehydrogenase
MKYDFSRILLVGYGSIGKRYVKIINKLYPKISIILLRHQKHNDQRKINGVDYCVSSIEDAIALEPQAAIIANPAIYHLDFAIPLANAGLHLLIEKPISTNSVDLHKLLSIAQKNNLKVMTGFNLRFLPSLQEFRKLVKDNALGKVFSVRAEVGQYLPDWRPNFDYRNSVSAKKSLGGGAILELCHEIDYLIWIFGGIDWVNAFASRQSNLQIDVEDTAYTMLGFERDKQNYQLTASLNMDFIRHDSSRKCTAICEEGSLRWDGNNGSIEIYKKNENKWQTIFLDRPEKNYTYIKELQYFFESTESSMEVFATLEDGILSTRVIEAIKKSNINSELTHIGI